MTEVWLSGQQPAKPAFLRPMLLTSCGLVVVLSACGFLGYLLREVRSTESTIIALDRYEIGVAEALERLGGPEKAPGRIARYFKAPKWAKRPRGNRLYWNEEARAVGLLEHCDRRAIKVLADLLQYQDYPVGCDMVPTAAAIVLSHKGPKAADAVPALIAALDLPDVFMRLYVAEALGSIGPPAAPAIPRLERLASDEKDDYVKKAAVSALKSIGDQGATHVTPNRTLNRANEPEPRYRAIIWNIPPRTGVSFS